MPRRKSKKILNFGVGAKHANAACDWLTQSCTKICADESEFLFLAGGPINNNDQRTLTVKLKHRDW